ncbi:nitrilase-related carbon-nitrogen hydrolase [Neopusillimonas aromaticivorans]|uniref:nitrilase-related carbon-nitrogen hydrolase n=1 Tax=Neopusillimonas aromaticivorans TaxID=2979868 RepID=UPI0033157481
MIDPRGNVQGSYDKVHLFNAVVNGTTFRASDVESAGDHLVIADINGVKVGLSICFDIRFPEMFRQMARAGAQVILVPAAFTRTTGKAHWEVLVRARAIENQAYVVASATIASEDATVSGFETWGHAMVAGPWGMCWQIWARSITASGLLSWIWPRWTRCERSCLCFIPVDLRFTSVSPGTFRVIACGLQGLDVKALR